MTSFLKEVLTDDSLQVPIRPRLLLGTRVSRSALLAGVTVPAIQTGAFWRMIRSVMRSASLFAPMSSTCCRKWRRSAWSNTRCTTAERSAGEDHREQIPWKNLAHVIEDERLVRWAYSPHQTDDDAREADRFEQGDEAGPEVPARQQGSDHQHGHGRQKPVLRKGSRRGIGRQDNAQGEQAQSERLAHVEQVVPGSVIRVEL